MTRRQFTVNIPKTPVMNLGRAAEYLGVSKYYLRNLVKSGAIPCFKTQNGKSNRNTYTFKRAALDNWANDVNNRIEG